MLNAKYIGKHLKKPKECILKYNQDTCHKTSPVRPSYLALSHTCEKWNTDIKSYFTKDEKKRLIYVSTMSNTEESNASNTKLSL